MKRAICIFLCAVLLLSTLTVLATADNEQIMYLVPCGENGSPNGQQPDSYLRAMYGDAVYFRCYTQPENGQELQAPTEIICMEGSTQRMDNPVVWNAEKSCYVWDTRTFGSDQVQISIQVGGSWYFAFAGLMMEDFGWFWTRNPSVDSALPGGRTVSAQYDGSKDVSVYLTATHTTAGARMPAEYTTPEGFAVKQLSESCWRVTCLADAEFDQDTGSKTLDIQMEKVWTSIFDLGTDYHITFRADGTQPRGLTQEADSVIGQLATLPVTIAGKQLTCYMGVGEYQNGKYTVLTTSSSGAYEDEDTQVRTAVGLWWKVNRKDDTWDLVPLTSIEAAAVRAQLDAGSDFALTVSRADGRSGELAAEDDENLTGMPCMQRYTMTGQDQGVWKFEASCTLGGERYTACGTVERTNTKKIELSEEQSSDVDRINAALREKVASCRNAGRYHIVVELTNTAQYAYVGQITIPENTREQFGVDISVEFIGVRGGTTLTGGICSENIAFSVSRVNFIGAGKTTATWLVQPGNLNGGAENAALYGKSRASASECTFTGYYYAIKCEKYLRMCGRDNTFRSNHIAWYLGRENENGGNTSATGCYFIDNDYAIWAGGFYFLPSWYAPVGCIFANNAVDVNNASGKWWFIPGNFFIHGLLPRPVTTVSAQDTLANAPAVYAADDEAGKATFCYPMAAVEGEDAESYRVLAGQYLYQQLDEQGDTISNALAGSYPVPASELSGKSFKVAAAEEDTILAEFSFAPDAEQSAQAAMPVALFAEDPADAEPEKSFNASVTVETQENARILTMHDPCQEVTVTLPCSFEKVTVTHGGAELAAKVADGAVVFQTAEAGEYRIEKAAQSADPDPSPDPKPNPRPQPTLPAQQPQTKPTDPLDAFEDLTAGAWYDGGVRYVLEKGLMNGVSTDRFDPYGQTSRAMVVTILWRLAGMPGGGSCAFTDVQPGSWYEQAVCWAAKNAIVTGVSQTQFQPDAPVTREQLAAILYRFAAWKGADAKDGAAAQKFADTDEISAYARDAVNWALETGLLTGVSADRLQPRGSATRAQLAVMLQRLCAQLSI